MFFGFVISSSLLQENKAKTIADIVNIIADLFIIKTIFYLINDGKVNIFLQIFGG